MKELTLKERLAADHYLTHGRKRDAVLAAGYAEKSAAQSATKLFKRAHVIEYLEKHLSKNAKDQEHVTGGRLVHKLKNIINTNVADFLTVQNNTVRAKDWAKIDPERFDAIASVKVHPDGTTEFKMHDRLKAIHQVSQMMGWLNRNEEPPAASTESLEETKEIVLKINGTQSRLLQDIPHEVIESKPSK